MAYFNTCEYCGCNLDPAEKCDCDKKTERNKKNFELLINGNKFQRELRMEDACLEL